MSRRVALRRFGKRLAVLAAALGLLGLLVVWAGLLPIGARSGHWPATAWFLHFAMRQSVQTYSLGIKPPSLDDPAKILRGAGHYDTGCAPCHGAPGREQSVVARHMTPQPPFLPPRISEWDAAELFWIVKHGIKFTGMPAWPARHRDDEIWSVVAFLQQLPELSETRYRQLTRGIDSTGAVRLPQLSAEAERALQTCARCHGRQGDGRGVGAFPRLAGQSATYLYLALRAYADGSRPSGIMRPIAAGLSEQTARELARHYAAAPPRPAPAGQEPKLVALGEDLARRGNPGQRVPACIQCHGPKEGPRNPAYPLLAGQYADYLALQLELWKKGHRGGSEYARIMHGAARRLSRREIDALAAYYASLPAADAPAGALRDEEP